MTRILNVLVAIVCASLLVACGNNNPVGLGPTPLPVPPPPIVVDVCSNMDGIQETIPDGFEDPDRDGVCTEIVVMPPPPPPPPPPSRDVLWSELPPLSPTAKEWVIKYNLNAPSSDLHHLLPNGVDASAKWLDVDADFGAVKKWNRFPIKIAADPWFSVQDLLDAPNLWQQTTNGKVTSQLVLAGADVGFKHQDRLPAAGACRQSWVTKVLGGIIVGAEYYSTYGSPIAAVLHCKEENRIWVAWALGALLGLGNGGENTSGDVMSWVRPGWGISPLTAEVINWLYDPRVQPGMRPK